MAGVKPQKATKPSASINLKINNYHHIRLLRESWSTLAMSHSSPSLRPKVIKQRDLPSLSLALQAHIVHGLSFIMFKLRSSSISSAGRADIKSYLLAKISNGNPANLSSYCDQSCNVYLQ
jgi:hypothetical protein